jgi:hypothetical protein
MIVSFSLSLLVHNFSACQVGNLGRAINRVVVANDDMSSRHVRSKAGDNRLASLDSSPKDV